MIKQVKQKIGNVFQHYAAIVITIIPCIVVTSLLNAIVNIFSVLPLYGGRTLCEAAPVLTQWCEFLKMIADMGLFLMPVFIVWATVKHFDGTPLYGIFAGLTMVPAGLANGMNYASLKESGMLEYWDFGIMQVPKAGFQGQMLAAILAGCILVLIEKNLSVIIPKTFQIFAVPLLSVAGTALFTYLLIGPACRLVESIIADSFLFVLTNDSIKNIGGLLLGLANVPMMMLGLHLALVPVNLQTVALTGNSPIWPITVTSVMACGGAALAELYLSKKQKTDTSLAREGSIITLGLGTVEPALFGVCCKKPYALKGAIIGAGLSGFICRFFDCTANTFGLNGFMSFLGIDFSLWGVYGLALIAAILGSFLLTIFFFNLKK